MQAVIFTQYGGPEVVQCVEATKPAPKADEVLVRIYAAAANPLDWHRMRGAPFLVRLTGGLNRPKDPRLGADIAGVVEAVGSAVTQFRPGDEVFGEIGGGGFAEYVCVREKSVVPKPPGLTFAQAAAIPVAGLTALQGLRDHGQIQAGHKVLVNGASGGVGTFAVQIAKAFGADVTGVCSTRNLALVGSIGADRVIDYTQQNFTQSGEAYDLIFDAVANHPVAAYRRALAPGGICVVAGFTTLSNLFRVLLLGGWGGAKVASFTAAPNQADLLTLGELVSTGKVTPVIDREYPLAETAEAIRYLETSRARGKVIITILPETVQSETVRSESVPPETV